MGFGQRHPVLIGLFILSGIFLLFLGGISLFFFSFLSSRDRPALFDTHEAIGVIDLKGVIMSPEEIIADLTSFRRNDKIKGILLRIDSPGGAVGASQEIYEEVKRTNRVKPVVASLGSVAASGGFYAALGAERILASPGTITGSMGVIIKFPNLEVLFDKIGYQSTVIKSGAMKDIGAANRPMTEEERALLQKLIDTTLGQFVRAVAESRSMSEEEVRILADGRIFSGEQALEHGLIDGLGNFTDGVMAVAELAGLKDRETPKLIYPKKEGFSFFKLLAGSGQDNLWNRLGAAYPILSYEWNIPF
jgi:protease-4